MSKFALKNSDASKESIAKILAFTDDDIVVSSADDLVGMVTLLTKRIADISQMSDSLMESSGLSSLSQELAAIKAMVKKINQALVTTRLFDQGERVLTSIYDEDPIPVDGSNPVEGDRILQSNVLVKETSYVPKAGASFDDFIGRLVSLNVYGSVRIGNASLSSLNASEVCEILDVLREHNLISAVSVSKVGFNSDMKMYPEKRQILIDEGFVVADDAIKVKKATNRQMSLFDEEDEVALEVIPNEMLEDEE